MIQPSIGLSAGAAPVQGRGTPHEIEIAILAGPDPTTLDLSPPAGFEALPGIYPDLDARSAATLEITRPDGTGSLAMRRHSYRLGGVARFQIRLARTPIA